MKNRAQQRFIASVPSDPVRSSVRFPLRLHATVRTGRGDVQAVTEDVSAGGVLFTMPFAPAINTKISWTLNLPADLMGSPNDVHVRCVGRVVWHGAAGGARLVGAVIDDYQMGEAA